MADLIDRGELLNILEKNNEIYFGAACGGYPVSKDIFEEIRLMNKADAERHARWIKTDDDNFICSNCHSEPPMYKALLDYDNDYYEILTNFCPNCGYIMNEVKEQ